MAGSKLKVGFIGLGLMGKLMAKNILKAGFDLTVFNRTESKTLEFKKLGASIAKSPKELASKVDVVIIMVTGPKDVENVSFGQNGISKGAKKGLIVIDMSTIGPKAAKRIGEKFGKFGIEFIDAPVTGSTLKAETGELTIFVGGDEKIYKKVKPILLAMGKVHHYLGKSGSGQAVKMINNQVLGTSIAALAEGMLLADEMGIARDKVAAALRTVPAMSFMMSLKLDNFVNEEFPLMFSTANMTKDLFLAMDEVSEEMNLPLLKIAGKLYKKALKKGYDNDDFSSVIKAIKA